MLNPNTYHLIKNVTLPTDDGSTQIDHIIVSKFGVFVVETKNMKGWIFGNPKQRMWTQKLYKHSSKFQNPLHQNYKHVQTLVSVLGLNDDQVHSVIVFVGDSKFKTELPENVTNGLSYVKYIKSKKSPVLTSMQIIKIKDEIEQGRLKPSLETNREHINHVKRISIVKNNIRIPKCPKCGVQMALRKAKKGRNIGHNFWGCLTFPKCDGIINVK